VAVVLTLQQEPLGKNIYLAGTLVQVGQKDKPRLFGDGADPELLRPRVWVAADDSAGAVKDVQAAFVGAVYDLHSGRIELLD